MFQTLVQQFASREGIPVIDPLADFRRVRDGLYFQTDLHWTPGGHRLFAEQLSQYLKQNALVARLY